MDPEFKTLAEKLAKDLGLESIDYVQFEMDENGNLVEKESHEETEEISEE